MASAIDRLVKKSVRNGRNAVAVVVDAITLAIAWGVLLLVMLWGLVPLAAASAFAAAGVVMIMGARSYLLQRRAVKAKKSVENMLFERCFASDLLEMDAKQRGSMLAMILACSTAMRVREENGVLLALRDGQWLPVVFVCLPMEETVTRRDIWGLTGKLAARGYEGALVITTGAVSESARSYAKQNQQFGLHWMGFKKVCQMAKQAGISLEYDRLEQAAQQELDSRPKPRRLHDLIHPRHIRRIAISGVMLLLLSLITAWKLYYRLIACAMLALAAFLMIQLYLGNRTVAQDETA